MKGKVQRQKVIAPRGAIKNETWQTLSRCLDDFDEIYSSVASKLKLRDLDTARAIDLVDEITKWRAMLRSSSYLERENYSDLPKIIYGEVHVTCLNLPKMPKGKEKIAGN